MIFLFGLGLGIFTIYLSWTPLDEPPVEYIIAQIIGPLPIIWGIGLPIAFYCNATTKLQKKKRETS